MLSSNENEKNAIYESHVQINNNNNNNSSELENSLCITISMRRTCRLHFVISKNDLNI